MKTQNYFPRPTASFVCIATFAIALTVAPAFSQPNPEPQPRRLPAPDSRPGQDRGQRPQPGFQDGGQMGQFLPLLIRVLTEEQRTSLREVAGAQRDQTREQEQKIRAARKEMLEATLAEKFDEATVRARALEIGKLEAELTVLRAKALSQLRPPLSPEQIEKLKNPPPMDRGLNTDRFRPDAHRNNRPPSSPRDENDLPPRPKPGP